MKVTILGSGSPIFNLKRYAPSFVVEANQKLFLFDCGWGCGINLLKSGYDIHLIDHILISHPHADHLGNLIPILESMHVAGQVASLQRPAWKRQRPLYLHGYHGFRTDYNKLRDIMFPERFEPYEIKVYEYLDNVHTFGEVLISGKKVPHNDAFFSSSAFRLGISGKILFYSGDCRINDIVIELAQQADLAVFETSISPQQYRENGAHPTHISPFEIGQIAAKARPKKVVLIHLYDNAPDWEIKEEIEKNYDGEIVISQDLQVIEV